MVLKKEITIQGAVADNHNECNRCEMPVAHAIEPGAANSEPETWNAIFGVLFDFISLLKPRVLGMSLITSLSGILLATGRGESVSGLGVNGALLALLGIGLAAGSGGALNMFIERESDGMMERTCSRPLPGGRISSITALAIGLCAGLLGILILWFYVNPLTATLGAAALIIYTFVYTPMKRRTIFAIPIGFIPGALPALMGWTAATGAIETPGALLFFIVVLWQAPHILSLHLYLGEDYAKAGIVVLPPLLGEKAVKLIIVISAAALLIFSIALFYFGNTGWFYLASVSAVGAWFFVSSVGGLSPDADVDWARRFFRRSLLYLMLLAFAVIFDGAAGWFLKQIV